MLLLLEVVACRYHECKQISWVKVLDFHLSHLPLKMSCNQVHLMLGDPAVDHDAHGWDIEVFTDSVSGQNDVEVSVRLIPYFVSVCHLALQTIGL